MVNVVFISAPMLDMNTPYSAGPRLTGWLRKLGHRVTQLDLNIELFLRMYSREGLQQMFDAVDPNAIEGDYDFVYWNRDRYIRIISEVIAFMQGRSPSLASRIVRGELIPEGPQLRNHPLEARRERFGDLGNGDFARHLCTLMLIELNELFRQAVSPHIGFERYAETLTQSTPTFDGIAAELERPPNVVERMMLELAARLVPAEVDLACFTCPFPGNVLASLMLGGWLARERPGARRALGGGFVSTELRQLADPRVFDYVDFVMLDDGEVPIQQICARIAGDHRAPLHRTFTREAGAVAWHEDPTAPVPRFRDLPAPDYSDLDMDRYVSLLYTFNPINRIQNETPWLKLTAAHGCYWKKCTFCDIHLSYIEDFDPLPAKTLADQMDEMHAATGRSGFHFTDEAAPPALLANLALELLRRGRTYHFWGNIRFDPTFTPDRCRLLAAAGMIAVTGGIEVASDTLLAKISKGITVPQVVRVLKGFSEAGIMTHAYLIYGYPGETPRDTVDSLEILRQLMRAKYLRSGFHHRFNATLHSPIGRKPELYGIRVTGPKFEGFAHYNLNYEREDPASPYVEETYRAVLSAVRAYGVGIDVDEPITRYLPLDRYPATTIAPDYVARIAATPDPAAKGDRLCWLGGAPHWSRGLLSVATRSGEVYVSPTTKTVAESLRRCHPRTWADVGPPRVSDFPDAEWMEPMRDLGLAIV